MEKTQLLMLNVDRNMRYLMRYIGTSIVNNRFWRLRHIISSTYVDVIPHTAKSK